ncbi:ABC transporter ATP-binding protein [Candidatus Galacturonibacter soehngenii]|uniref:ABC transporter ATP-binding protein n=1 Tax=Candidatus Galacturonatibacter soehngenii TaxID=2307010 RepID=A0A7V7QMD6_9FIRM|nr:ABC transporter ATP-binding protein [Candidatus Galacturonibacter soehngenii]KAB1439688.1 ABC transporter ATP-binding protein [Candidatus Galacturonibacter soehngenii]
MSEKKILEIKNLTVDLRNTNKQTQKIIHDISFELYEGECLGILGESGSGKSMSVKAILGLLNSNFIINGKAMFFGVDLLSQTNEKLRQYRGNKITMILQNPMTCFDPLYTMEKQIKETWMSHIRLSKHEMKDKAMDMLARMQLKDPEEILKKYPHQLSGGMLQRITIGLALSMEPDLIVADEPTTAIDAITQYEIMKEFEEIKKRKTAMIFISHDLSVVSQIADRIIVMNQGKIAEQGDLNHIMLHAKDSYTKQLVSSKRMVLEKYNAILQKGYKDDYTR